MPLTVNGTLMAEQEYRKSTIQKRYSLKKVSWAQVIDTDINIFNSTTIPQKILNVQQQVLSGGSIVLSGASGGGGGTTINASSMNYIITLTDKSADFSNLTTVTVSALAAINPTTNATATKNEFDIYINGQYIDKELYTWTPSDINSPQSIVFDTTELGYNIESTDTIIINGRWKTS